MNFTQRNEKPSLSFGVLSDLHMTHRGEGLQKLSRYMALFSEITPKIDAHVFAGDIIYQIDVSGGGTCETVYHEPYLYLGAALQRYAKDTPLLYAIGNHEYPQHNLSPELTAEARRLMEEATGKPLHYHEEINGYHFVVVDIANYACDITEETEKWAMKEIRKALSASDNKPVFVVYHPPIYHTVEGAEGNHHSEKFAAFLLSNRRIINICGHLHTPMQSPLTIWQKKNGATVIHAPMAAVGYVVVPGSAARHLPRVDQSQALYFEVFGSRVFIHKIDVLEGKEVGEPWEIDTTGALHYTDKRKSLSAKPAFPKGAKAKVRAAEGGVLVSFPKAYNPKTPFNDDSEVPYYRFAFTRKGETEECASLTWHSDFYMTTPRDAFEDTVRISLEKGDYRVKITPVSHFGKTGRSISATFSVTEKTALPYVRMEDPDLFPLL